MAGKKPKKAMTEDELRSLIDYKIGQSVGSGKTSDAITSDRLKAMKYYKGEPLGDEKPGKSSVISRDVAEVIDATLPSLLKIFSSGDEVVSFNPTRADEEGQAAQRTDYANWIWSQQNPGYMNFHNWFKDALLQKLGTVKVFWEESTHMEREEYEGLTDAEYQALLEDENLKLAEHTEYPDPDPLPAQLPAQAPQPGAGGPLQAIGQALGLLPKPKPPMLHDAVFRRCHDESQVRITPVPPDETLINRQSAADELPWGNRRRITVADLIEEFPDKEEIIRDLPQDDQDTQPERNERFRDEGSELRDTGMLDDLTREVWVVDAYLRVDFDGDGYAEFRKVTTAGTSPGTTGAILDNVEYDDNPFCCLTPVPMPHKLIGMSQADQTVDLQEVKTTLIRQGLDNVYLQNGSETFVTGDVDIDALLNRRPGNVIRGAKGASLTPLEVEPMLGDIMTSVQYFDSVRDQRTGAPRHAAGPGADTLDNAFTQTLGGAAMVETSSQERVAFIARTFAETGVKRAFQRIDELVSKHQQKSKEFKLRGVWITANPADWRTKMDCTPAVGLGTNNKTVQVGQLSSLVTGIMAPIVTMQGGLNGPLVTPQSAHYTLTKLVETMGFKGADRFFPDPTANPPQQQPPAPNPDLVKAQSLVHTTQMKNDHDMQKTQLTLESEERRAQLTAAVQRELGYAKIAVDNKAIDAEVELKHSQHQTDTAFKAHAAHLDERSADREDAKAQHDAQHDTAELTQKSDQFQTKQSNEISAAPPKPRKLVKIGLTHDAGGMVAAAHRHFDDGTSEEIPITRQPAAA
jgi:hypothetical protein